MQITLYKMSKRSNSTKKPTNEASLLLADVRLKEGVSIYSPTFIVSQNVKDYNYVKWVDGDTTRYYFINDYIYIRGSIFELDCNMDYLATYWDVVKTTRAMVEYSTNATPYQIDTRIGLNGLMYKTTTTYRLYDIYHNEEWNTDGVYVLNYTSQNGDGYIALNKHDLDDILEQISSTSGGFVEYLNQAKYSLTGAYESILGCKYIPFSVFGNIQRRVYLSGYDTGVYGWNVNDNVHFHRQFTISHRGDPYEWINSSYNNTYKLYLPNYGFITLDGEIVRNNHTIDVDLYVDGRTGLGFYIINNELKYNVNFGVNVQLGVIRQSDPIGTLTGMATSTANFLMGNVVGAGASVTSTIMSAVGKEPSVVGSCGGNAENNYNNGEIVLINYYSIPNSIPAVYRDIMGVVDGTIATLSTLTGYVQTLNVSVSTGIESVNNIINNLLDGGVYIE